MYIDRQYNIKMGLHFVQKKKKLFGLFLLHNYKYLCHLKNQFRLLIKVELDLFYVENIAEKMKVEHQGMTFQLLPYTEGMIWNELLELLYIEKSDLKGQSAEDKVITVFDEAKSFDTKADIISLESALAKTIIVDKDLSVGPV